MENSVIEVKNELLTQYNEAIHRAVIMKIWEKDNKKRIAELKEAMEKHGIISIDNDEAYIRWVEGSTSTKTEIDERAFEHLANTIRMLDIPELTHQLEDCYKETTTKRSSSLRILPKE